MLDWVNNDAFSVQSLADAMDILPYVPGDVGSMGLFVEEGIPTTAVTIEQIEGELALIPNTPRGTPHSVNPVEKRKVLSFIITHLPANDSILADQVTNVRAFGTATAAQQITTVVNRKLAQMKQNLEVTKEYQRVGALQGQILDADGTVIYNLFTEFGITETTVAFDLANNTNVQTTALEAARAAEAALQGIPSTGLMGLCTPSFFDAFISNDSVKAAYANAPSNAFLRSDPRSGFFFGDIFWREYRGKVGSRSFMQADTARIVPISPIYEAWNGPADWVETVGTLGRPWYARQELMPMGKGVSMEGQGNPLPMCKRPGALIKCTK